MAGPEVRSPLEPGESLLGSWFAGLPALRGRGVKYGGVLVLTNRRLIWEPISLHLPAVARLAPGMRGLDALTRGLPLARVVAVRPDVDRGALLHVDGLEGSLGFLVGASRMTPVWSAKNRAARDAAAAAIQAALSRRAP